MLDSLKYVKQLEEAGVPRAQAEVQVSVTLEAYGKYVEVAKRELEQSQIEAAQYRYEISKLQREILQLKADLAHANRRR